MVDSSAVKCAKRFIDIKKLSPPVDVDNLIKEYATLEYTDIPLDVDGLCLDLKKQGLTRVFINKNKNRSRQIFTAAHELGHIIIPWHTGSIIDENIVQQDKDHESYIHYIQEIEANQFASELLLPTDWIVSTIAKFENMANLIKYIRNKTNLSYDMIHFRIVKFLASGYIFCKTKNSEVVWCEKSHKTIGDTLTVGEDIKISEPYKHAQKYWHIETGSTEIHWWKFGGYFPNQLPENYDWREILQEIFIDIKITDEQKKFKWASLNSILASGRNNIDKKNEYHHVYDALTQKMEARRYNNNFINKVCKHKKYEEFLYAKAFDLSQK